MESENIIDNILKQMDEYKQSVNELDMILYEFVKIRKTYETTTERISMGFSNENVHNVKL